MKISHLFSQSEQPESLSFMTAHDYNRMINLVRGRLIELGLDFTINRAEGTAQIGDLQLGFINLGQMCSQRPYSEWQGLINEMLELGLNVDVTDLDGHRFDAVKGRLKLRINALDLGPQTLQDKLTLFDVCDQFLSYLVVDHPKQVSTVSPETANSWGVSRDDLLVLALENVWQQDPVEPQWTQHEHLRVAIFEGESFFTASHFLMLNRHIPVQPEAGLLAIVPNRHFMMVQPLDSASELDTLHALAHVAQGSFEEGPGSITDSVFWIRGREIVPIQLDLTDTRLDVLGPVEFLDMASELRGDPH